MQLLKKKMLRPGTVLIIDCRLVDCSFEDFIPSHSVNFG